MSGIAEARAASARTLLHQRGLAGARVQCAGAEAEIAAVQVSIEHFDAVRHMSAALRDLGFRYVAIELIEPESELS